MPADQGAQEQVANSASAPADQPPPVAQPIAPPAALPPITPISQEWDEQEQWLAGQTPETQERFKRVRGEAKQRRLRVDELEQSVAQMKAEQERLENDRLKKQANWKELYEKKEMSEATLKQRLIRSEIHAHAMAAGFIDSDLIEAIPADRVVLNDTGHVVGAAEAVAEYRVLKPRLFAQPVASQPEVRPTGSPAPVPPSSGKLAPTDTTGMSREEYAAYKRERYPRLRV